MRLVGKCSSFGGPDDTGVAPDEGLAFIFEVSDAPGLFLPEQPPGTTGLARRLDPAEYYIAVRWNYDAPGQSKQELLQHLARVTATKTGMSLPAAPADWGPSETTGRVADLSPGLLQALGIETDDEVEVEYPVGQEDNVAIHRVAISAGHGENIPGMSGILDECEETPKVMAKVAEELRKRGVTTVTFWDRESTTVGDNLGAIIDWHNAQVRDLDVSIHFNSSDGGQGHGVEVLYATQEELAAEVSAAVAANGLTDRGAKYRDDLAFLNGTTMPAILVETCFLDNQGDVDIYESKFNAICRCIAEAISDVSAPIRPPRPPVPPEPVPEPATVDIVTSGAVVVTINGVRLAYGTEAEP